jgi:hypothetical protein
MKPRIPFRIGYQYSNWEMDLDADIPDRIPENKMYVSYLWIGENKPFLNFIPDKSELIFYWDRLCAVILAFEEKDICFCKELNNALEIKFGLPEITRKDNNLICRYSDKKNVEYWCIFTYQNTLNAIYGKKEAISLFLPVLSSP